MGKFTLYQCDKLFTSVLKRYRNDNSRLRNTRVIVENKVGSCYGRHCRSIIDHVMKVSTDDIHVQVVQQWHCIIVRQFLGSSDGASRAGTKRRLTTVWQLREHCRTIKPGLWRRRPTGRSIAVSLRPGRQPRTISFIDRSVRV